VEKWERVGRSVVKGTVDDGICYKIQRSVEKIQRSVEKIQRKVRLTVLSISAMISIILSDPPKPA
jgi:hypothetical protein